MMSDSDQSLEDPIANQSVDCESPGSEDSNWEWGLHLQLDWRTYVLHSAKNCSKFYLYLEILQDSEIKGGPSMTNSKLERES